MAGYPMYPQQQPLPQPPAAKRPDPEGGRKMAGIVLYILGMLFGGFLLFAQLSLFFFALALLFFHLTQAGGFLLTGALLFLG